MNLWILVGIAAAVLLIAAWVVAWALCSNVVFPKVCNPDDMYLAVTAEAVTSKAHVEQDWKPEPFELRSEHGYMLRGTVIPRKPEDVPADGRERVVVIVHGVTVCAACGYKYVDIFRDRGFTCVLYDHRNHGRSDKAPTTMGWCESDDLLTVIQWSRARFGENCVLGLHGESMGAATVMMTAPRDPSLAFVIEDCGYSSLPDEIAHVMKIRYHIPRQPFLAMASLLSRLRGGVAFEKVIPRERVQQCEHLPMLFVHGEADDFVPYRMVHELYAAKPGPRARFTVPGAAHAQSVSTDRAGYTNAVDAFLRQYGVL